MCKPAPIAPPSIFRAHATPSSPNKSVTFSNQEVTKVHVYPRSDQERRDLWIQPREYNKMYSRYQKEVAWKTAKKWLGINLVLSTTKGRVSDSAAGVLEQEQERRPQPSKSRYA